MKTTINYQIKLFEYVILGNIVMISHGFIFNPNNVIAEWLCTYSVLSMNDEDDR